MTNMKIWMGTRDKTKAHLEETTRDNTGVIERYEQALHHKESDMPQERQGWWTWAEDETKKLTGSWKRSCQHYRP